MLAVCAQSYFRPELLNRLDEIVVFKQLSMLDARTIAELLLNETRQRMAVRGIGLQVTAPLMCLICQQGYNQVRPATLPLGTIGTFTLLCHCGRGPSLYPLCQQVCYEILNFHVS